MDTTTRTLISRRRFLARSALTAGAVAGAGSLLNPDATPRAAAAPARDTTSLSIMYLSGELSVRELREFERLHPGVKIQFHEYNPVRLAAMTAAGTPPDFVRAQGAPALPNIIARGLATNLDDRFKTSKLLTPNILLPVNDVYKWDGKMQGQGPRYGAAKGFSQDNMFWINKNVFDRAGVRYTSETEPIGYDELLALAKKVTVRKGGKIQVYGLDVAWGVWMQGRFMQMLQEDGKSLWSPDYTQADFTSPEIMKILKWHVDWAQAGVGPASPLINDTQWDGNLLLADRLGILMYGYWFQGYITGNDTHTGRKPYQLNPSPQWGAKRISGCYTGTGAYIPSGARQKDLAWRFMEYFCTGLPARDRATSGWGIPATTIYQHSMPRANAFQKDVYQTQQHELPYLEIIHFGPYVADQAMENAIQTYMLPVMKGEQTLAEGAKKLEDAVNKLVRLGKEQVGP
jgi:multiple sugar transport system substrate-binding protein